jgi:hypothetical protein
VDNIGAHRPVDPPNDPDAVGVPEPYSDEEWATVEGAQAAMQRAVENDPAEAAAQWVGCSSLCYPRRYHCGTCPAQRPFYERS